VKSTGERWKGGEGQVKGGVQERGASDTRRRGRNEEHRTGALQGGRQKEGQAYGSAREEGLGKRPTFILGMKRTVPP
jgi:hypothetical protein